MSVVFAVLGALVFSPLPFVLACAAGVLLWLRGARRAGAWVVGVAAACLLGLSLPLTSDALLHPLENRYADPGAAAGNVDAVVVLGGGVNGDELSSMSLQRAVRGLALARDYNLPLIFSGGTTWASGSSLPEATVAAAFLQRMGMPGNRTVPEGTSTTTWQNAREVGKILRARGWTRVALVTSAWHLPRAALSFRAAGVSIVPVPAGYLSRRSRGGALVLLPSFDSLRDCFIALHEYAGLAGYALRR